MKPVGNWRDNWLVSIKHFDDTNLSTPEMKRASQITRQVARVP
jgi:hypothetical protein